MTRNVDTTNRLFVTDITKNLKYLVDSGADISDDLTLHIDKQQKPNILKLYTANGTTINTYCSTKTVSLILSLRRLYC